MYGISSITADSQNMSSAVGITVSSCKEIEHLFLFGRLRRKRWRKKEDPASVPRPWGNGRRDKCYFV